MLKVGVFGVGHLGKFHLNNWKEIEGIKLVGFFDPNNDNAKEVTEKYGLKRFMDEDKLMDACDIIDVITPTNQHYEICMKAVKDLNLNPMFIEVHRLAQFNPRGTEVSVILDLMIHDIDIILSLVKSDVKSIAASGVAVMTETPDIANVRIEFNNGCVANLTSSRISMKKMRKMRLFQKDAYIGIDFLEKKTEIIKLKQPEDENVFSFDIDTPNGKKTIAIATPSIEPLNAIKLELTSFVDAILNNKPTQVNEIDGYLAMEVAHQILEKINNTSILV